MKYRPIAKLFDRSFHQESPNNKFIFQRVDGTVEGTTLAKAVLASTKYEIFVAAETSAGRGDSSVIEISTSPATGRKYSSLFVD